MKKTLTAIIIILLVSVNAFAGSSLPEDSWAYKALATFEARGMLSSTIPRDRAFLRTEAADMVLELIDKLPQLSAEDALLVEALQAEFAYELALLGEQGESRKKQVDALLESLHGYEMFRTSSESTAASGGLRVSGLSRLMYRGINVLGPKEMPGGPFYLAQSTGLRQEYRIDISGPLGNDILLNSYILGGGGVSFDNRYDMARSDMGDISLEEFYLNVLYRDMNAELGKVILPVHADFVVYDKGVTGISMGSASSRFLIGKITGEIDPYVYAFGGFWSLSELNRLELGAMYLDYDSNVEEQVSSTGSVTSLDGKLSLSDILTLRGEYAMSRDDTALRVGADVKLGAVTLGAGFHTIGPKFDSPLGKEEESDVKGYDFETRVNITDLISVFTKYDELEKNVSTEESGKVTSMAFGMTLRDALTGELALEHEIKGIYPDSASESLTSIDFKYYLTGAAVVRAGYRLMDRAEKSNLDGKGGLAILGIDYDYMATDDARVRAGYTFERAHGLLAANVASVRLSTSAGLEYSIAKNAKLTADYSVIEKALESTTISTSLGLNYDINRDTALSVGYRLLDFAGYVGIEEDYKANMALAELTIKF